MTWRSKPQACAKAFGKGNGVVVDHQRIAGGDDEKTACRGPQHGSNEELSAATQVDPYPGEYPPDDTGSSQRALINAGLGDEFQKTLFTPEVWQGQRDRVVSREQLMAQVWDENWFGSTKTLDVTIGRLRQKLESAGVTDKVVAVRGVGFRLEGTPPDA